MKLTVEKNVFKKFPGVEIGVLVITSMDNKGHNAGILGLLRGEEKRQKELLTGVELGSLPEVNIWRKIYKDFGSGKDYRSSVESLLRRARGGEKPLPQINNLVDLYNYLSLRYHLPSSAEDLDKVEGDVSLSFADGSEKGIYLGGDKEEAAYKGEVIYKDKSGFICRRWNWREADRTKIDQTTANAVLVIEKAPGVDDDNFQKSLEEAGQLIKKYLQGQLQVFILDEKKNSFDIIFTPTSKSMAKPVRPKKQISPIPPIRPINRMQVPSLFSAIEWESRDSLSYQLKQIIYCAVTETVSQAISKISVIDIHLEHPKVESYGDYSTNVAMMLSKVLDKKSYDIANLVKNKIDEYIRSNQSISYKTDSKSLYNHKISPADILENISLAGPGFINLTIRTPYLITLIQQLPENENGVISTQIKIPKKTLPMSGRKIMIEFAHPNTHKAFHIGHVRNISTGETIVRILEELGSKVIRSNYQGDVGLHIAKTLYALIYISPFKEEVDKAKGVKQRAEFLGKAYAAGSKVYEENTQESGIIKDINFLIYACAQKFQQEKGLKPGSTDYSKLVDNKSVDLDKVNNLWILTRQWSLDYFETIYKKVYTHYDRYYFESECLIGLDIANDLVSKEILQRNEGAIIIDGKPYGLDTRVFVNSLGLPTYEAKELALAEKEFSEFGMIDQCIHVVGPEQASFFQVTFKVEELIDPKKYKDKQFHYIYGWVRLKKGKMSSRLGNVVLGEWLLDEAKKKIYDILDQSEIKYTKEEQENIAEKVAVAAVKYSMLRVSPRMEIAFDIDESVSFEGDSGPYLLYTYARCRSVLRKAQNLESGSWKLESGKNQTQDSNFMIHNSEELGLLRTLYRFPEVVTEAAKNLSPNLLCTYLFDLAQKYNLFYNKHSILNLKPKDTSEGPAKPGRGGFAKGGDSSEVEESVIDVAVDNQPTTNFRLFLTSSTAQVIKRGLYLLGIETVERM